MSVMPSSPFHRQAAANSAQSVGWLPSRSDQIVHITGWVKVSTSITGNQQGATLQDSIMGPGGALHWQAKSEWQKIDLIREVPQSENLILTLSLNGLGSIQFDDLRVIAYTPEPKLYQQTNGVEPPPATESTSDSSELNLLKNLP